MAKSAAFEELKVWNDSRNLNRKLFILLREKNYADNGFLVQQLFRTAGSIMDNIAEGMERGGNRELIQFLAIAKGSSGELKSQLFRAIDFKVISKDDAVEIQQELDAISRQLGGFMGYLKKSDRKGYKFEEGIAEYQTKQ